MNIKKTQAVQQVSKLLKEIGTPSRIRILLSVGWDEACVCHLEATLGMRQAYLSQHLMALRKAGILITKREGRYINYRLADPKILEIVFLTAKILDVALGYQKAININDHLCTCPKCIQLHEMTI